MSFVAVAATQEKAARSRPEARPWLRTATLPLACFTAAGLSSAGLAPAWAQTLPSSINSGVTVGIPDNQAWTVGGAILNQGTVAIGGTAHPTLLELTSSATLSGGGTVSLANSAFSEIGNGSATFSYTLTNQDNTITGSGRIGPGPGSPSLMLVNGASGKLDAESGGNLNFTLLGGTNYGLAEANNGGTLTLGGTGTFNNTGGTISASQTGLVNLNAGNPATNTGLIQAVSGGTISLNLNLNNAGGTVLAQGTSSQIAVNGGIVAYGTIQATSGGSVILNAGTIENAILTGGGTFTSAGGSLSTVTLGSGASVGIQNGTTSGLSGTLTNQGTLAVGGASQATILNVIGPVTLTGGGTVTLANGQYSDIGNGNASISNTLTNQNNTIVGSGQIGAASTTYGGGGPGAGLTLVNQSGGRIEATGSAGLSLTPISLTNYGTLRADSGSVLSVVGPLTNWNGATLTGGTFAALNGTIAFTGAHVIDNAATIVLSGANSALRDTSGNDGLRGLAANLAGGSLTVTEGRTLTTPGAFSNGGQLVIGPGGTVDVGGGFTQTASAALDFVLGESSPSTLIVDGGVTLGGSLDVSLANGFSLAAGEVFELIQFGSGSLGAGWFTITILPDVGSDLTLEEFTLADEVELRVENAPEPLPLPILVLGIAATWFARVFRRKA